MAQEGRPTDYDFEIATKVADDYVATCSREQTKLPKLTEYYRLLGITRETGNQWQDIHPEFSDICKKIATLQEEQLTDDGMYGGKEVNAGMAIFLLKTKHGYKETTITELGGVLNENGEREPIKLFVNAGQGFIPAAVPLQSLPVGSVTEQPAAIQSPDLAPESPQNIHSDNGGSEAGTPA